MLIKRSLLFFILFCGFGFTSFAQSWKYTTKTNDFDGQYKIAYSYGHGEFPYEKPFISATYWEESDYISINIGDVGYAGCGNKVVYLKFNGDNNIYWCYATADKGNKLWFLDDKLWVNERQGAKVSTIEMLKKYSNLTVRLDSDCGRKEFKFSLRGSTKAINHVCETKESARKLEELKELKDLKTTGIITDKEFQERKEKLLN